MIIAIRADGGKTIGMGHIMRTLTLAKELRVKGNDVFYICKAEDELINKASKEESLFYVGIEKIEMEGFAVKFIRQNRIEDICDVNADLLITDSYAVDTQYFDLTKTHFKITAYIDDENKLDYFNVDFIINQNAGAEAFNYNVNKNTKLLLGSPFVMLRDEFRNADEKKINTKVKDIMFTIGGSDFNHITEALIPAFNHMNYNFHIVVGAAFENTETLKDIAAKNIKLYFNANMSEVMKKCDIAISACGTTLYELSSLGVPAIGIVIADNQVRLADKLNELGVIVSVGDYDKLNIAELEKTIMSLDKDISKRKRMSKRGNELVDGRGVERIAASFMKSEKFSKI
ncbi:UDP-2,4-diacetamido-2,4,6-trideoxy-beta-L-altropyranose hydrolase [Clostridium oryzae]|uniref:UDP-N-acetylglucosamine transferase n=1 Tax=Clostridium oryzae TaxID=1450648 RepID=A0A1V4IV38_9CLOT|nr:UDP-2,4-diacetamido-2,4,6-trideoxy-beta-L-altropyranose hydrolase [Clostridium oryzae]OPJ63287.1 UDP-N-acetylglucosamine transferase [Clostridium oryzae]